MDLHPPEGSYPAPPIDPLEHELPLDGLYWKDFERLCLQMARCVGEVEHCQMHGTEGQRDHGVDIYVRLKPPGHYDTRQCKRYKTIKPADVARAVDAFLDGKWADRSDAFHLYTSAHTEDTSLVGEIERQAERLRKVGVAFESHGAVEISLILKAHADLVFDFFGAEWVRRFNGEHALDSLTGRRLDARQVVQLRKELRRYYAAHFNMVDPGLPSAVAATEKPILSLEERYVVPDILEPHTVVSVGKESGAVAEPGGRRMDLLPDAPSGAPQSGATAVDAPAEPLDSFTTDIRRSVVEWVVEGNRSVLVGTPGSGKSTFLRIVALDLLSESPRHEELARCWGAYLPVWVPFAMWVRMVSDSKDSCALSDVLSAWLHSLDAPEDLRKLVIQALSDERLLLLVDGLDEWTNETAARSAFVSLRTLAELGRPMIATSRPQAVQRLSQGIPGWRSAHLSGLNYEQQRELARLWFRHHGPRRTESSRDMCESEEGAASNTEAERFVERIHRDASLARLAETPLLLSGMIALSIADVHLPRNRFKAYEKLTDLLLRVQPQKREEAAMAREATSSLTTQGREKVLARLAFEIQNSEGAVSIGKDDAARTVAEFLEQDLGRPAPEARAEAERFLDVGAGSVGLIQETLGTEIGFLHLALQEFLAAKHIARESLETQLQIVKELVGHPRWKDVVLCLLYLSQRESEVDSLLQTVIDVEIQPDAEVSRELMLAEAAFCDLNCSISMARRLAGRAFDLVEVGGWMPGRRRTLQLTVEGLRSDMLGREVRGRLELWYPNRLGRRGSVYAAMSSWSPEADVITALLRGLHDEDESSRAQAAVSLAALSGGNTDVEESLRKILKRQVNPGVVAAVLRSLSIGWSDTEALSEMLAEASESAHSELKLTALRARVSRGEHGPEDKEALIALADARQVHLWRRGGELAAALVEGWPGDAGIRQDALDTAWSEQRPETGLDPDVAWPVLLFGFPGDDEVAAVLAKIFRDQQFPGIYFRDHWDLVRTGFQGHHVLAPAIDEWLSEHKSKALEPNSAYAALASGSPAARQVLLERLSEGGHFCFWSVWALLDRWGMTDPEVATALKEVADDPDRRPFIAHLLPQIISDRDACRQALLDVLSKTERTRADFALRGLAKLGCDHRDTEIVAAALGHISADRRLRDESVVSELISGFGGDPRVREIARDELSRRYGVVATVARFYSDDAELRREVIGACSALPTDLRLELVERLAASAVEDAGVRDLLKQYDDDTDVSVKTAASIEHYTAMRRSGESQDAAIRQLKDGVVATGPDLEARRLAAAAGLIALGRADLVAEIEASTRDDTFAWRASDYSKPVRPMIRHVLSNWEQVKASYADEIWSRFGWSEPDSIEALIPYCQRYPHIRLELLDRLESSGLTGFLGVETLRFLAQERRQTGLLYNVCRRLAMTPVFRNWVHAASAVAASEILGRQFADVEELKDDLERAVVDGTSLTGPVIALCEGWPESGVLRALVARIKDGSVGSVLLPARIHLTCATLPTSRFATWLGRALPHFQGDFREFLPSCTAAIVKRLTADEEARNGVMSLLNESPKPAAKANLPRFLRDSVGLSSDLRQWCLDEIARQRTRGTLPEMAVDITVGRSVPVEWSLLEALAPMAGQDHESASGARGM